LNAFAGNEITTVTIQGDSLRFNEILYEIGLKEAVKK
jgi:hypothetical protein